MRMEELKLEQLGLEVEAQKRDMESQPKWLERDMRNSNQEVNRRGIEACLSVLKCEKTNIWNKDLANDKIKEFLEGLQSY